MTFLSLGLSYFNGSKMWTFYPINLIVLPLLKLFGLDAPIISITSYED